MLKDSANADDRVVPAVWGCSIKLAFVIYLGINYIFGGRIEVRGLMHVPLFLYVCIM